MKFSRWASQFVHQLAHAEMTAGPSIPSSASSPIPQQIPQQSQPIQIQTAAQPIPETSQPPNQPTKDVSSMHYFVIVPTSSVSELQRVQTVVPTAQLRSSYRGTYIEVQGFPDRISAETLNLTMRRQNLDIVTGKQIGRAHV